MNVAARVASLAARGQFLVTTAVQKDLDPKLAATSIGRHSLKGVTEPLELVEVAVGRYERPVDPVCGMVIDPASCTTTLQWRGADVYFCSEECRERFTRDPGRYS